MVIGWVREVVRRFCVKCGALESPENPIVGGLCLKCLKEEKDLFEVKGSLHLVVCPVCGSYLVGSSWYPGADDAEETIAWLAERLVEQGIKAKEPAEEVELVSVRTRKMRGGKYVAEVTARVSVKGHWIEQTQIIPLNVEKRVCEKCLKKSGGDYDATLQIRSERGTVTQEELREAGEWFSKVNNGDDIVDFVERREGLDVLLASKEVAKRAAQLMRYNMGAKVVESHSVVGMSRDGRVRTRLTLSVRIPSIKEGEGFLLDKEPAILTGIYKGKFHYYLLHSDKNGSLAVDDWWSMRKSKRIVYLNEKNLDVGRIVSLNPLKVEVGSRELEAEGPVGLQEGQEVYVVIYKGKVYVLPKTR
ncbi:hypothetical protein IPA_00875 [Ignicoccus pacificus DSM 13166]|uniref:Nmd3 N-terminal domain-containing protein n=1 Tax=Ignicoccus pacificus DSM 13166 TaxID=940294 RepID=A0A977KAE2_9CREN|nr:hypothetical protein IPA_00875 [Ignicoccus pacificus DSM 13166]